MNLLLLPFKPFTCVLSVWTALDSQELIKKTESDQAATCHAFDVLCERTGSTVVGLSTQSKAEAVEQRWQVLSLSFFHQCNQQPQALSVPNQEDTCVRFKKNIKLWFLTKQLNWAVLPIDLANQWEEHDQAVKLACSDELAGFTGIHQLLITIKNMYVLFYCMLRTFGPGTSTVVLITIL